MASDEDPTPRDSRQPGDLRYVGPATADLLEEAPFSAADIEAGRVSYRALLEVGIQPAVAERLRREHALVWAFRWQVAGGDLPERADRLSGLDDEERAWIAASDRSRDGAEPASDLAVIGGSQRDGDGRALAAWLDTLVTEAVEDTQACPRCGGGLDRFDLDDHHAFQCGACGWAGIPVDRTRPRRYRPELDDEEWEDALHRFLDDRTGDSRDG